VITFISRIKNPKPREKLVRWDAHDLVLALEHKEDKTAEALVDDGCYDFSLALENVYRTYKGKISCEEAQKKIGRITLLMEKANKGKKEMNELEWWSNFYMQHQSARKNQQFIFNPWDDHYAIYDYIRLGKKW
jgi:hypothetical protein